MDECSASNEPPTASRRGTAHSRRKRLYKVHDTEILASDTRQQYREKIARITLDSMVQFVGLLDAKGTVLEINKVALDAVGIQLSEVEGKPFWTTFWWQVSEEINQTLKDCIARAAQGEFVRWDTPIYGRAGGKETIIIDASLVPVKDDKGRVVFITAEGRDITEKKAQEKEIARKGIELQGLLERIRELDEIKTQFFANVSHELRTPLQLVIGPAERLSQNDSSMTPAQRQDSARVIARNARMLLKRVNDLLDIAKFEAGKLKIDLRNTDIDSLLRITTAHFDVLAHERGIAFQLDSLEKVMSAIDLEKIQRVVMNLLSNAFKFTPDGGTIRLSLGSTKKDFTLAVEDSGPGVKPALRKAIFERFRQGDGGANRNVGGTGLGLAIAKEFVEMHHGTLEVADSSLGGACFQMTIPLLQLSECLLTDDAAVREVDQNVVQGFVEELRPSAPSGRRDAVPLNTTARPRLLVVEDNPEMNQFIAECLAPDYEVISAYDGAQGFEKALEMRPSLIVSDIMMPRVSGVEMIERMRENPVLAEIPILLLTAKADEELKLKLLAGSAQDFIAKPFAEQDLRVRVKNLLELKKAQENHRTLFNCMEEGFCIVEMLFDEQQRPVDFVFLETNAAFQKQTGLQGAPGKRMRELVPEHEDYWFEVFGQIAMTGQSARFENKAAALGRWYEVYAFRVGAEESRRVAIFFKDVTERRQMQETLEEARRELARNNEELERRVASRTASLAEAVAQMEEFSYSVSHDLRAPVRTMQGYARALLEDYGEKLDSHACDYLNRIVRSGERMDRLVQDILTYSRLMRSDISLQPVSLDLLVRDIISQYPEMQEPCASVVFIK